MTMAVCGCKYYFNITLNLLFFKNQTSYFDRINMTKNWLEYDRKKFTPMNMNVGT